jgi:pyrroloquinoline quinone (PQQ) biosynthesis protein C
MSLFFEKLGVETQPARNAMLSAPILEACQAGTINQQQYIAFLTQAYHHVKHTVPLLMACGGRLPQELEWLRQALAEYIEEEQGHHEWILNDIKACGGDAEDVRNNRGSGKVSPAIELMVAYLYHQIDRGNPMALFGMVWVLEGTSVGVGGQMARLIQSTLDLPDEAMSYLKSHSELDQQHIQFFAQIMDKIESPEDQWVIVESANMVYKLYGQMLAELTNE